MSGPDTGTNKHTEGKKKQADGLQDFSKTDEVHPKQSLKKKEGRKKRRAEGRKD